MEGIHLGLSTTPAIMHTLISTRFSKLQLSWIRSLLLLGLACVSGIASARPANVKPNIIFIMLDDMSAQAFNAYGGDNNFKTPVIDRLADEGLVFEHCHSMPMCDPSRSVLTTGKYLFRFGGISKDTPLFSDVLKSAGYHTGISGKWMLRGAPINPPAYGFDEALVVVNGYRYWDTCIAVWNSGGLYQELNQPEGAEIRNEWEVPIGTGAGEATMMEGGYGPEIVCNFAVDFIQRNADKPFALYYPLKLPHDPQTPTPYSKNITEADKHIEHDYKKMKTIQHVIERNAEFLSDNMNYVDRLVGRVEQALKDAGIEENTILFFTTDNGLNDSYRVVEGVRRIPGAKGMTLDGGTRVPMIVSWPGTIEPGSRSPDMIHFVDVLPTMAQAAGAELPEDEIFDGVSFFPQIIGEKGTPREWVYFHEGNHEFPTSQALAGVVSYGKTQKDFRPMLFRWVRGERFKLYNDGRLHDLEYDYAERHPIAPGAGSAEAEAARAELQVVMDRYGDKSQWKSGLDRIEPTHDFNFKP